MELAPDQRDAIAAAVADAVGHALDAILDALEAAVDALEATIDGGDAP